MLSNAVLTSSIMLKCKMVPHINLENKTITPTYSVNLVIYDGEIK
jgi:hypothetical protein